MDPATMALLASLGMQGGKMLFDIFKQKPQSPTEQAKPWLDKAQGLYDPYMQQGQDAYGKMNPILSQMAQDPAGYLDQLMKGYEPSQAYQQKFGQMSQAAANTAAAGGMRGSLQDVQNQADLSRSLMGDDMQQWLKNAMGAQGAGLSGLGHFYDTGYDATNNMGNIYGNQANLAMLGEMFKQMQAQGGQNDMWNSLGGIGGSLAGLLGGKGNTGSVDPFIASSPRSGMTLGGNYGR